MLTIGEIMRRHASDKGGPHQYGPVYDSLFPDRDKVTAVLELGVANGHSIRGWCEAFPNALIVGLDKEKCIVPGDRIEIHQGDQTDLSALEKATAGRLFDLIVDDASHKIDDQIFTLVNLRPNLKPGGYYVIEEFDAYGNGPATWANEITFPGVEIIDTIATNGVSEPLVVIQRK